MKWAHPRWFNIQINKHHFDRTKKVYKFSRGEKHETEHFIIKTANKVGYRRDVLQHMTDAQLTTHWTGKADAYPHMTFVYLLKFILENCATKKRNTKILYVLSFLFVLGCIHTYPDQMPGGPYLEDLKSVRSTGCLLLQRTQVWFPTPIHPYSGSQP